MPTPDFLRSLIELATCESVDQLLDHAHRLLERSLGLRTRIELWDDDDTHYVRGDAIHSTARHCTWIGVQYTIGAIHVLVPPADAAAVELLANQLAPLAERLLEQHASQRRSIRDDIARLYDRRIRDALMNNDWNASAVARTLRVGRGRVAMVAQRWRSRTEHVFRNQPEPIAPAHEGRWLRAVAGT